MRKMNITAMGLALVFSLSGCGGAAGVQETTQQSAEETTKESDVTDSEGSDSKEETSSDKGEEDSLEATEGKDAESSLEATEGKGAESSESGNDAEGASEASIDNPEANTDEEDDENMDMAEGADSDWYMEALDDKGLMEEYPCVAFSDINQNGVPVLIISSTEKSFIGAEDKARVYIYSEGHAMLVKEAGGQGGEVFYANEAEHTLSYTSRISGEEHLEVYSLPAGELSMFIQADSYQPHHYPEKDTDEAVYLRNGEEITEDEYNELKEQYASESMAITYNPFAYLEGGSTGEAGDAGDAYAVATSMDKAFVESFAMNIREAVLSDNWEWVSDMLAYPFTTFDGTTLDDKEAFLSYMEGKKPEQEFLDSLEAESCEDMFANSSGISMADGYIWFAQINVDGTDMLRIISMTGI